MRLLWSNTLYRAILVTRIDLMASLQLTHIGESSRLRGTCHCTDMKSPYQASYGNYDICFISAQPQTSRS